MTKTLFVALIAAGLVADAPGSLLTQGMQLVYSSGEQETPPWTVTSVRDTAIGANTACRVITLTRPSRPLERREWCVGGDMVLAWDTASKSLRPIRPVGEGMSLVVPGGRGNRLAYNTRSALEQTVSGLRLNVIETVVVTRDSSGKQVSRLREFYAPALATATSGVFEVPDSTQGGGWRIQSSFKLVRVVR